ncbi:MAG TPA: hypothetical protein VM866_05830, partial [Pyrinomonadaceae bacterium]|nr:hypothetical protein [Pyrinomonadaceae bacterium]
MSIDDRGMDDDAAAKSRVGEIAREPGRGRSHNTPPSPAAAVRQFLKNEVAGGRSVVVYNAGGVKTFLSVGEFMERIVFLDRDTLIADLRRPSFAHEWREYGATAPGEVVERLRDATIAITNKVPLRENDLRQLPQVKFIAVAATGMDNIDLDYCSRHKITVANVRGYSITSLPEHVLMMMLAL